MIETFNLSSSSSTCHSQNNCYRSDEPTYVNETQLLFFNNEIANLCQRPEFPDDENDKTMRYVISRSDTEWNQYRSLKETEAAVIIQRAYRSFRRQRSSSEQSRGGQDESINYIEFWDDCEANRRSGYSLITTSNSASDSKNSGDFENHDEDCDEPGVEEETEYRNDHIYDSIPYDLSSPSPPDSPNKRLVLRQSPQDHHSQCPLSKQRKHSVDLNRLTSHPGMFVHRHSDQHSPHSVIVYEEDLRKVNPTMYVVRSRENQPVVMTINQNCPTHKVYHNNNNKLLCSNYSRVVSVNNNHQQYANFRHSRPTDETQRLNLLHKQSKIIQNQKIVTAKRMYRIGLNIFNKNPAAGINYLIKYQYIKGHPSHIAKFLLTKSGISRNAIGDYLGSISDPLALQVTKFFLRRINMKNKEVDEALRSFIYYVHLPGESQKICHLMEEFKEAYLQQNESRPQFRSKDTIMILAYAIIMLQTDAHNQSIRKSEKMTLEQFVTNLRGVDENSDIDRNILEHIYTRVTGKEIKTQPDHTDQVRKLNDVICGSVKPTDLINRIRRFMCYCRLAEIVDDTKKNKSDAHQREVFLFNDILLITKVHNKSRKEEVQYQCKYSLALVDLRVKLFSIPNYTFGVQILDRKTNDSLIKLNAQCEQDQKKFMFDLSDCIFESLEMLKVNYSDYLSTSSTQSQNSPKGSPSNLACKSPRPFSQKIEQFIPNPPRRQESLVKNERPDVVQSVYRVRNQSFSENDNARLKGIDGKPHLTNFYS